MLSRYESAMLPRAVAPNKERLRAAPVGVVEQKERSNYSTTVQVRVMAQNDNEKSLHPEQQYTQTKSAW